MRLAILYARFGPYHLARLREAARRGDLVAVEASELDRTYAWPRLGSFEGLRREVLFPGADVADQPLGEIRRRIAGLLERVRPDVVAIPSWGSPAALCLLEACLAHRVPVVMMTDSQQRDVPRQRWKEALKRRAVRCSSAAFVSGRRSAAYVRSLGVPGGEIRTGCDVVDNRHFADGADAARRDAGETRRRLGLPDRYLLGSGRFVPQKNLERLLDAFADFVRGDEGQRRLVLLGDGPLRAGLERRAARPDLAGRVVFPGFRDHEELPAFYGLAEGFLLVSVSETWGLVVNEAMAAGLPVIVSEACGCAPDLVDEPSNGLLCDARDTRSITAALRRLTDETCDREAMGRASRARIEDWSPRRFADGLWDSAAAALRRGSPPPAFGTLRLIRAMAWWARRSGNV